MPDPTPSPTPPTTAITVPATSLAKKSMIPHIDLRTLTPEKKVSLGLGLGTGVLLFLGAPIYLPIAAAGGAVYYFRKSKHGQMTPERKKIYEEALKSLKDPAKLKTLALAYRKEGLTAEADLLDKRAGLYSLPKETQQARRVAFKEGMASTNVHGVEHLAAAFEGEGATGAAEALRVHASALKTL